MNQIKPIEKPKNAIQKKAIVVLNPILGGKHLMILKEGEPWYDKYHDFAVRLDRIKGMLIAQFITPKVWAKYFGNKPMPDMG